MTQLLLIALATFASEDLTCIATGVLIAQGRIGFVPGALACLSGIFAGDLLLYFAGRMVGRPLVRCRPLRRLLSEQRLDRASVWLAERGAKVILASRFTPGLRLPTYVAAGILRTRFWTFAGYFLLAAAVWTPLLVGASALLGDRLLRTVFTHSGSGVLAFAGAFGFVALVQSLPRRLADTSVNRLLTRAAQIGAATVRERLSRNLFSTWAVRRRLRGFVMRKLRWEFWPAWVAYLPLIPYFLFLAVKHRSLTLFTLSNPGIPTGGLKGESKSAILAQLGEGPAFTLLPASNTAEEKVRAVEAFQREHGFSFPIVLKPDVGERGRGVAVVRDRRTLLEYLATARAGIIAQEYVSGLEFGIFYIRYPHEPEGRIFSITWKCFPEVTGDGRRTMEELILADDRAVCLAAAYLERCGRPADSVPARGERVRLVELGSHCRGAIFLNAADLGTEALRAQIDRVAQRHPGFYFGRFDLRAPSVTALREGRFSVLELNGAGAEATHIYDPSVSILDTYRTMFAQWRIAFEIGAEIRAAGAAPMRLQALLRGILTADSQTTLLAEPAQSAPVLNESKGFGRQNRLMLSRFTLDRRRFQRAGPTRGSS